MIASTSISSQRRRRGTRSCRRGTSSRSLSCASVSRAAVGLDEADDHVEPVARSACASWSICVGLADAGRGADVDAQPRAVLLLDAGQQRVGGRVGVVGHRALPPHRRALVEREVQLEHVDARLAEEAELPPLGVRGDERAHVGLATARARARRAAPGTRPRPARCADRARTPTSSPGRSAPARRDSPSAPPRRSAVTRSISFLLVGPSLRAGRIAPRRSRCRRPTAASGSSPATRTPAR